MEAHGIRLAAGLRSDPFFADVEGALHGFAWTGHDDFAGNNVDSIVLEVPGRHALGARSSAYGLDQPYSNGVLEQLDRGGNPTINPFINPDGEKNLFNSRPARRRRGQLPGTVVRDPAERPAATPPSRPRRPPCRSCPTSCMHAIATQPASYPNGRVLTDDVYSLRFAWLTNGKVPPSGLKPHDDLLAHFPYLGPPNA